MEKDTQSQKSERNKKEEEDKHASELEQNKREAPISLTGRVLTIGFVGGVFWSLMGYVAYLFNFTEIRPSFVLAPWAIGEWKEKMLGDWIGIFVIGLISMVVAFAYKVVLAKFRHMYTGVVFGLILWALVFYLLRPMFPALKPIHVLGWNTLSTTICLYALYGLFIGFSISFEYTESDKPQQQGNR